MKNTTTILNTAQRVVILKEALDELSTLKDEAFSVFSIMCLDNIKENFETAWKMIFKWKHKYNNIIYIPLNYSNIERAFLNIDGAYINRKEFEEALKSSCEEIENGFEKLQAMLNEEEEKLNKLYNKFAKTTGNLKFIFQEDSVKQLIINNLLKQ